MIHGILWRHEQCPFLIAPGIEALFCGALSERLYKLFMSCEVSIANSQIVFFYEYLSNFVRFLRMPLLALVRENQKFRYNSPPYV